MSKASLIRYVKSLLKERGTAALEEARDLALSEVSSREARTALRHLMSYFHDYARPTLMALACEAVGGNSEVVSSISPPLILLAAGIDIHDDIIDHTFKKDRHLTVLGKSGKCSALLVGDILFVKGLTLFSESLQKLSISKDVSDTILAILRRTFLGLADGEITELRGLKKRSVPIKDCLKVMELKGSDVEAYTRIGAILGSGSREEVEALGRYGKFLGALIVLRDDLIDFLDTEGGLSNRHSYEVLPLPIFYALRKRGARELLLPITNKSSLNVKDCEELVKLVRRMGGIKEHKRQMRLYRSLALEQLEVLPETRAREDLVKILESCSITD